MIGKSVFFQHCQSCQTLVSYTEDTVYHIVKAGLSDLYLQQKCVAQALLNDVKNINKLIEFCNAHESSKLGQTSTLDVIKSIQFSFSCVTVVVFAGWSCTVSTPGGIWSVVRLGVRVRP